MKVKQNALVLFNINQEGEYGLLNPLTRKLHKINDTGRFIWEACAEPKELNQLSILVSEHYNIPLEAAAKDVKEFVDHMMRFELLEEV